MFISGIVVLVCSQKTLATQGANTMMVRVVMVYLSLVNLSLAQELWLLKTNLTSFTAREYHLLITQFCTFLYITHYHYSWLPSSTYQLLRV